MIRAVDTYLAARRAAGFELKTECYLLFSFARFAAARGEMHVHTLTAIDWASRTVSVAQRDARLKAVCRFARYMSAEDRRHELPPSRHFGYRKTRPLPHIYPPEAILRLMDAALKLGPPNSLHPQSLATLIRATCRDGSPDIGGISSAVLGCDTQWAADSQNQIPKNSFGTSTPYGRGTL
jgi:integrase/recombinase XerD